MTTSEGVERLAGMRGALERSSTAERVAEVLRDHIIDGAMQPGERLSEESIGAALGVSRNTLRESFRLLKHERLLVHEFNRGVFVAKPTVDDVIDLYRVRRALELPALRGATAATEHGVERIGAAVRTAETAIGERDWARVGTANMHFHQAIAALVGSPRIDETVHRLLAELRLVFHVMEAPREFHVPYVPQNREVYELLRARRPAEAADRLARYFDTAETQLVEAFRDLDTVST